MLVHIWSGSCSVSKPPLSLLAPAMLLNWNSSSAVYFEMYFLGFFRRLNDTHCHSPPARLPTRYSWKRGCFIFNAYGSQISAWIWAAGFLCVRLNLSSAHRGGAGATAALSPSCSLIFFSFVLKTTTANRGLFGKPWYFRSLCAACCSFFLTSRLKPTHLVPCSSGRITRLQSLTQGNTGHPPVNLRGTQQPLIGRNSSLVTILNSCSELFFIFPIFSRRVSHLPGWSHGPQEDARISLQLVKEEEVRMFTAICLFAFTASRAISFHRGDDVISNLRRRIVGSSSPLMCWIFCLCFLSLLA